MQVADDEGLINKGTVDYLQLKNMDKNAVIDMTEYIIPLISPSYIDSDMGKRRLIIRGLLDPYQSLKHFYVVGEVQMQLQSMQ